jgi:hypothetical protein
MDRRTHWLCLLALLGCLAWWVAANFVPGANAADNTTPDPEPEAAEIILHEEHGGHDPEVLAHATEVGLREAARVKFQRAAARTQDFRQVIEYSSTEAWSRIIATNRQAFLELRARAAAQPGRKQVACTICDGRGSLAFCILCKDTGKCPTCRGEGNLSYLETCPTCLGTGKCYVCGGSGHMFCPFCEDGVIDARAKMPPQMMRLP